MIEFFVYKLKHCHMGRYSGRAIIKSAVPYRLFRTTLSRSLSGVCPPEHQKDLQTFRRLSIPFASSLGHIPSFLYCILLLFSAAAISSVIPTLPFRHGCSRSSEKSQHRFLSFFFFFSESWFSYFSGFFWILIFWVGNVLMGFSGFILIFLYSPSVWISVLFASGV